MRRIVSWSVLKEVCDLGHSQGSVLVTLTARHLHCPREGQQEVIPNNRHSHPNYISNTWESRKRYKGLSMFLHSSTIVLPLRPLHLPQRCEALHSALQTGTKLLLWHTMGTFVALSSSLSSRHAKAWVPHVSPCCAGSTSLQFGAGTNQLRPLVKFWGLKPSPMDGWAGG